MSVIINPAQNRFLNNWIQFGNKPGEVDLTVSWDNRDCAKASSVIEAEYKKLGAGNTVRDLCELISKGDPTFIPFRAWIQISNPST